MELRLPRLFLSSSIKWQQAIVPVTNNWISLVWSVFTVGRLKSSSRMTSPPRNGCSVSMDMSLVYTIGKRWFVNVPILIFNRSCSSTPTPNRVRSILVNYSNEQWLKAKVRRAKKWSCLFSLLLVSASESNLRSMTRKQGEQGQLHSFDNLAKISSFGTLNSSMLFAPRVSTTDGYITPNTVVKVMQQQLLRKESLLSTHLSRRREEKEKSDDADSSSSSQRDSGLGSAINDGSSDDSPRDSLVEQDLSFIDHSYPTCKPMASKLRQT